MDDAVIHAHLDALLRLREHCLRKDPDPRSIQRLLKLALQFVPDLMTDAVFERAMKRAQEGEGVLLFANRVQLLKPLLDRNWPIDFTFDEMVHELFGIAHGDAPRILQSRGRQGQFRNAHALVAKKLDAHLWYKVLGQLKMSASARQALIIEHYVVTHDSFLKWRKEAKDKLGSDYIERYLVSGLGTALSNAALQEDSLAWATDQLILAAASYRDELKRARK